MGDQTRIGLLLARPLSIGVRPGGLVGDCRLVDWSRIGILVREFSRTGGLEMDWSWIGQQLHWIVGVFMDWSKIVRLLRDWNTIGGLVMYCQIGD